MQLRIEQKLREAADLSELTPLLGGGQSYAFSALDMLNRKIFLKVYWYSDKYKDSLLQEPRKLSDLFNRNEQSRTHVVGLYSADTITLEQEKFIVLRLEFCEGSDLSLLIDQFGLSTTDAISIGKEMCQGIHYLHSSDIAHRDIKPANIMISGCKAKIIDLGSVIEVGGDSWRTVSSGKTHLYSPPESLGKERSYCKVSDVFQIGAVLWEMFYGKFDSARIDDSVYSKIKKRLKYPDVLDAYEATNLENETVLDLLKKNILFDSITAERQHVPKSITKLLKRCTAFDPSKRFESAASVRNALSGIVVPNWKMHNDTHYTVNGWRGKDYRISIETKKGVEKCYFESAATETANYRCVKSITTLKQAIEAINN